ncbi:MAG: hypothetical protein ACOZBZ_00250 [Patescibacteria group bacterium]
MGKLGKILKLSDPYPNLWYEFLCYVKAALGGSFLIFGIFLIFHPLFYKISFFGLLETGLSPTGLAILAFLDSIIYPKGYLGFLIWGAISILAGIFFLWQIKLVRKLAGK